MLQIQQPLRRIENDPPALSIDGDDALDERYENTAAARRVDLQQRTAGSLVETHCLAERRSASVEAGQSGQLVTVMDALRRRVCLLLRDAQLSSSESAGRVDIGDPFEGQQQILAMGADRDHSNAPLLRVASPTEGEARNEAFRERGQRLDRELAFQAMRTPDHADEKK
jgi:hypothetical protein